MPPDVRSRVNLNQKSCNYFPVKLWKQWPKHLWGKKSHHSAVLFRKICGHYRHYAFRCHNFDHPRNSCSSRDSDDPYAWVDKKINGKIVASLGWWWQWHPWPLSIHFFKQRLVGGLMLGGFNVLIFRFKICETNMKINITNNNHNIPQPLVKCYTVHSHL